jgi:hypothetical protein
MVVFEPQTKQQEFIDAVFSNKYSFLVFGGAMGGGKSYVSVAILILIAKLYPNSIWCIIRESLPVMKNTVIPTFKKICPKNFILSYNQSEQKVYFTNGSQLWFMAEDYQNDKDFDRFKGLEVNGFLLEQIEELQEGLLDICTIRAGRHKIPNQPKPLILATVNPTMNWVKKRIYTPWLQGTLPKGWYYLPSTITDNPALSDDKEYIERFDNLDPITKRRYIEGDWTAFKIEGQILYCFDHLKHVKATKYEPSPLIDLWISFDFNVNPMTCTIAQRPTLKNPKIFDEIRLENSHTEELCKHILAKYPGFKYMVTGDASGTKRSTTTGGGITDWHIIVKTLKLKDFQIRKRKANLPLNDSITICNAILYHLSLEVMANCEGLIADMTYAVADEYGKPKKDATTSGLHFFDNFRYMMDAMYPDFISNPKKYQ